MMRYLVCIRLLALLLAGLFSGKMAAQEGVPLSPLQRRAEFARYVVVIEAEAFTQFPGDEQKIKASTYTTLLKGKKDGYFMDTLVLFDHSYFAPETVEPGGMVCLFVEYYFWQGASFANQVAMDAAEYIRIVPAAQAAAYRQYLKSLTRVTDPAQDQVFLQQLFAHVRSPHPLLRQDAWAFLAGVRKDDTLMRAIYRKYPSAHITKYYQQEFTLASAPAYTLLLLPETFPHPKLWYAFLDTQLHDLFPRLPDTTRQDFPGIGLEQETVLHLAQILQLPGFNDWLLTQSVSWLSFAQPRNGLIDSVIVAPSLGIALKMLRMVLVSPVATTSQRDQALRLVLYCLKWHTVFYQPVDKYPYGSFMALAGVLTRLHPQDSATFTRMGQGFAAQKMTRSGELKDLSHPENAVYEREIIRTALEMMAKDSRSDSLRAVYSQANVTRRLYALLDGWIYQTAPGLDMCSDPEIVRLTGNRSWWGCRPAENTPLFVLENARLQTRESLDIAVAPNPVSGGRFTLEWQHPSDVRTIALLLHDASGREVLRTLHGCTPDAPIQQAVVFLPPGLAAGTYALTVVYPDWLAEVKLLVE